MDKINPREVNKINKIFAEQVKNKSVVTQSSAKKRKAKLKKLLKLIYERRTEIEEAIFADFGKPPQEVQLTEIYVLVNEIKNSIRKLKKWMKPIKVSSPLPFLGSSNKIIYEPKGVSLIISPWNYPFQLALSPVVAAVAAGNCAIIKPSEKSPNTSKLIKKIIKELFNDNEIAVIEGGKEIAKVLLEFPFDHIFYTGGAEVGKIVMRAAAKNLTSVTLELGGKSPVIIDQTANLKDAASKIVWGKFINAGQTCIAPDYLLVHTSIKKIFIKYLKESVNKYYCNLEDISECPHYSGIINEKHVSKIKKLLKGSIEEGAKIELGSDSIDGKKFISPTILSNVSMDSQIMKEEIFGPLLPVIKYKNESDINNIIERNSKPLALYIFSKDKKFITRIIKNNPSGGAAINDVVVHYANVNLPFGGVNTSGMGKSHGYYGFKEFSNERGIMKQSKIPVLKMLYPPYNGFKNKIIDLTVKYF